MYLPTVPAINALTCVFTSIGIKCHIQNIELREYNIIGFRRYFQVWTDMVHYGTYLRFDRSLLSIVPEYGSRNCVRTCTVGAVFKYKFLTCCIRYYMEVRGRERNCMPCACDTTGSTSTSCSADGKCNCLVNFGGKQCNQCSPGFYKYPECLRKQFITQNTNIQELKIKY